MCYYDMILYDCKDWKWGNFRLHCNREYRMGETCGMKLVNGNIDEPNICKICQKIATKIRRRETELKRYEKWRQEGRLSALKASVQKCLETVNDLEMEIRMLQEERIARYNGNLPGHNSRGR